VITSAPKESSDVAEPRSDLGSLLAELDHIAPDVPLLGLGQTVFWDEPMKAGIVMELKRRGSSRPYYAGVHDTDYFARAPRTKGKNQRFKSLPHNDTTTKEIWSAAAEFSSLFGSETPIRREVLAAGGVRLHRLESGRPGILDSLTEAWGWRGVVSLEEEPPVAADVPIRELQSELISGLDWAITETLKCLSGESKRIANEKSNALREMLFQALESKSAVTLSDIYESMLPKMFDFVAEESLTIHSTRTSKLLQFNGATSKLPRFELFQLFVDPATSTMAKMAYNRAVKGSGVFELDRFGAGATPFELYIPGIGRGTLRLGDRGAVIQTPKPQFLSFKKRPMDISEIAYAIEKKFGPNCALVGKAVALIGMLAREFIFVFHEGASAYVKRSRLMHQEIEQKLQIDLKMNPILRLRYDAWGAIGATCVWLNLPEPLRRPFGADELCSPSFAERWPVVRAEQKKLFEKFSNLRRPVELIRFLQETLGGAWQSQADEYLLLQSQLANLRGQIECYVEKRHTLYQQIDTLKMERVALEKDKGDYFRSQIYEKSPPEESLKAWSNFQNRIDQCALDLEEVKIEMRKLGKEQGALSKASEIQKAHARRYDIEFEAELIRARLLRDAVIATDGLEHANLRPTAWQFPMVSPDGTWLSRVFETAYCYLEPLT